MNYTTVTSDKSKKTALICCAAGGLFGVHQFYVGNIGKGFLYAFTMGLFIFGWIGDLIKISTGSFRDNAGAPLRK
ncbi:MAG: TM2 domain-containing protein [Bacilli bacterium]|nr:TM2 domain-containing protein [Bacilli bacterium]